MLAIGSMNPNFGTMFGGTSTNCSAVCGSMRNVREQRDGDGILGTAITSSGTGVSRCRSIATSWSTPCGTGMSRIWIMGTASASCSTVRCLWPERLTQAGWQGTPGSSSYSWKSPGWGGSCTGTWPPLVRDSPRLALEQRRTQLMRRTPRLAKELCRTLQVRGIPRTAVARLSRLAGATSDSADAKNTTTGERAVLHTAQCTLRQAQEQSRTGAGVTDMAVAVLQRLCLLATAVERV